MTPDRAPSDQPTVRPEEVRFRPGVRLPPLKVWLFAFLFGLIFIGSFELESTEVEIPPTRAFPAYNRTRLQRFAELSREQPDRLKVVLLGNSLIKYATEIDEESFSFSGSDEMLAIRIVNNWANFSDFEALTDQILELEPDLIVMQAVLLGRVRLIGYFTKPAQLQHYLTWRVFGRGEWDPLALNHYELQTIQSNFDDQTEERFEWQKKSLTEWQGIDLQGPNAQQASEFIEAARQRGISIVLLYLPVTDRAEEIRIPIKQQLADEVHRHMSSEGVTLLLYPHRLEDSQFSDFVHMNENGRPVYSKWLVPELLKIARAQSRPETTLHP